jgi:hypothetical protein
MKVAENIIIPNSLNIVYIYMVILGPFLNSIVISTVYRYAADGAPQSSFANYRNLHGYSADDVRYLQNNVIRPENSK